MAKKTVTTPAKQAKHQAEEKRRYVSQADIPAYGLEEAMRVPEAIADNYALSPTRPLLVAQALSVQPTSPSFRQRCGAAIAFGLTEGGYNASQITVTPLARRILRPTVEGDDLKAKREAFLKPRITGLFLTKYDNAKFPRDDIAMNVLAEMGVPEDSKDRVLKLIADGARSLGLVAEINGSRYVNLQGTTPSTSPEKPIKEKESADTNTVGELANSHPSPAGTETLLPTTAHGASQPSTARADYRKKRVFITHGKDRALIDPIKKLLGFGELEPVVSVEKQTVSLSIPDKVMSDMRSCGAAIIHIDAEQRLLDKDAIEQVVLNPNVLIEIGAAMALYGKRFILLVREGAKLPSNLQGLYEVRYKGDALDGNATIRLLESINDIKNHPLPE